MRVFEGFWSNDVLLIINEKLILLHLIGEKQRKKSIKNSEENCAKDWAKNCGKNCVKLLCKNCAKNCIKFFEQKSAKNCGNFF